MDKINISAIIICKNEESRIEKALKSVSFCEEIIIVDSGSTDDTLNIAKKYSNNIIVKNTDNFSELRNIGLNNSKHDWILYIDADEVVTNELKEQIIQNIKTNEFSAYFLLRKNFYFKKYQWPKIEKIERLFRKNMVSGWKGNLHESPIVKGPVGELTGFIDHYTHRSIEEMVIKTNKWSDIEAENRFKLNHPRMTIYRYPKIMFLTFVQYYIKEGGYKLGTPGFIESMYQVFSIFITYAKLWELQENSSDDK